jgi:hypothetical protein
VRLVVFHPGIPIVVTHVQAEHMFIERSRPFHVRDRIDGEGASRHFCIVESTGDGR